MMKTNKKILGLTFAALLSVTSGFAQTAPATRPTPPATTPPGSEARPHTPNENASDTARAVQGVLLKFDVKRDLAMAERKALLDRLQAAKTDAERQAIIAELRTESQAQKDAQSAMGKEIRDELKKLRELRKTGGT